MTKYKPTPEELKSIQNRIADSFLNGKPLGVWEIVRNNDNDLSRAHLRTLCPSCPSPKAPMKAWRAWVGATFPEFEATLAAKHKADAASPVIAVGTHEQDSRRRP